MRTVTMASLRLYRRRYLAALTAVAISVTFIVTIGALNASAKDGLTAGVGTPVRGADTVATELSSRDTEAADAIVEAADAEGGAAAPFGYAVDDKNNALGVLADDETLRWQELVDGQWPSASGELVVGQQAAKSHDASLGDSISFNGADFRIVGVVDSSDAGTPVDYFVPWEGARNLPEFSIESVLIRDADTSAITAAAPGVDVISADAYVQDLQTQATQGVDVLTLLLMVFATVALTVAAIVIANTFSILFAQRTSEIAMLRCIGATRRQVRRSVRFESLIIGLVSSVVGVLVGLGLGYGIVALIRNLFPDAGLGAASVTPVWIAGAFAVGVVVTMVAAWLPTRSTTRISPLEALRPADSTLGTPAGRVRVGIGVALLAVGTALLAVAIANRNVVLMLVGGALFFVSVLVLGPSIVPPMIRGVGRLIAPVTGATGRLATDNAIRNPRRTATTTSALLVGVTLTSAVVTGMASSSAAIAETTRTDYPLDAALTGSLPADTLDEVLALPGVEKAVPLSGTSEARIDGLGAPLAAVPRDTSVVRGTDALPDSDEIALPADLREKLGSPDEVTVTVGGLDKTLTVTTSPYGPTPLVDVTTMRALSSAMEPVAVWVSGKENADSDDLVGDLEGAASGLGLDLYQQISKLGFIEQQLTVMTAVVIGLLSVAVLIALVGIGSTLGLSVLERRRENALLRALGVTRRQLRGTLTTEALLLAGAASVLGVAIGTLFGWIGVRVMVQRLMESAGVIIPFWQLAVIVAVASLAGVLASVLPSRRASRTPPAAGLTLE